MMIRRTLFTALGLAAVIGLGGCVVHDHGHNGVQTRTTHSLSHRTTHRTSPETTHNPRVLNITPRSYPHFHPDQAMHSHVGGQETHDHGQSGRADKDYPAHQRGYHQDAGRDQGDGHTKSRGKGHDKGRGKGHDIHKD
jgi:hypothetical protein